MRFSLVDLFIAILFQVLGCAIVVLAWRWLGRAPLSNLHWQLFGIALGWVLFLGLSPPIYRRLRLLPLFLPVCPHCKKRPSGYQVGEAHWPRVVVACGNCKQTTELWWSPPSSEEVSKTVPSLLLVWPQSIGLWRVLSRGNLDHDAD
ncbi:MAG: hypothetical protein ACKV0T_16650 [Planctomycetales bacterium]